MMCFVMTTNKQTFPPHKQSPGSDQLEINKVSVWGWRKKSVCFEKNDFVFIKICSFLKNDLGNFVVFCYILSECVKLWLYKIHFLWKLNQFGQKSVTVLFFEKWTFCDMLLCFVKYFCIISNVRFYWKMFVCFHFCIKRVLWNLLVFCTKAESYFCFFKCRRVLAFMGLGVTRHKSRKTIIFGFVSF